MEKIINLYLDLLWRMFNYDIDVLSNPWMYIPLLIPVLFYIMFMVLKWTFLLIPAGIVSGFILAVVRSIFGR